MKKKQKIAEHDEFEVDPMDSVEYEDLTPTTVTNQQLIVQLFYLCNGQELQNDAKFVSEMAI